MRLDGWLRQDHSLGERLRVLEALSQAVNAVHDQGKALAALEPSRIEVGPDGSCDVSAAHKGSPSAEYLAPDRQESGESSTIADVYAAGVIAWELLVGRTPGPSPAHVAEVRPEVPREVADAVMACLERTPDWRPKDLTYLAQIAAAKQSAAGGAAAATPARATRPSRTARGAARESDDRPSRRTWPLLGALVVVLALAGFAWWQYMGPGSVASAPGPARPSVVPAPVAVADAEPPPETVATPAPRATATPVPLSIPEPANPVATPEPMVAPPRATPTPAPTPTPTPRTTAGNAGGAAGPPPPAVETPVADIPPVAPPTVPAELTAVSPLTVSRGGKALLDVRGTSLRTTHRVQIVPLKKAPAGITVVRQKLVSDVLITVLLDLTRDVSPGEYGVVVEEVQGGRSNTLVFTVAK